MEAKVYNTKGEEAGKVELPESLFGLKWNSDLVNQVVLSLESSKHGPWAHARDRAHVRGGGKKPWKQKGTGRARHGSTRSPIWVGGGVSHGPLNEKIYDRKVNKGMKAKALFTILSAKAKDGEILFVNDLGLKAIKTKNAAEVLSSLSKISGFEKLAYKTGKRALILTPGVDSKIVKSFRNIGSSFVDEVRNLNPIDALKYKYLVMVSPEESVSVLSSRAKATK
ncbi:MAG: 50S ribosomal protein L4 [Candidatus Vogelbacteria bacterium]|nr:50S ribosomal protein L4 [Candidatus Vogelbacteria bacterium]